MYVNILGFFMYRVDWYDPPIITNRIKMAGFSLLGGLPTYSHSSSQKYLIVLTIDQGSQVSFSVYRATKSMVVGRSD